MFTKRIRLLFLQVSVRAAISGFVAFSFIAPTETYAISTRKQCKVLLAQFARKTEKIPIPIEFIDAKYGRFRLEKTKNYDPKAIYIGVGNNYKDGSHHYYVIIGTTRLDVHPAFAEVKIKLARSEDGTPPLASEGVVFKLKVTDAQFEEGLKNIPLIKRDWTCLHAVQKLLNSVGIPLLEKGQWVSAATVGGHLISGDIKNANGQKVPVEVIATSKEKLVTFLNYAQKADSEFGMSPSYWTTFSGMMGTVFVPPTLYLFMKK